MAKVKVWNGTSWVDKTSGLKRWNGTSWVTTGTLKFWNGTSWVSTAPPSSYPTIFGSTTASATDAATLNPTLPAGYTWQANDLGLLIVASNTADAPTISAGWTTIAGSAVNASYMYGGYRVMQSGDTAPSITTTGAGTKAAVGLIIIRNAVLDGTPQYVDETVVEAAHPAPAITTTGTNRLIVYMFGEKSSTNTGWTDPSGTTRILQQLTTGGGAVSCLATSKQQATAATVPATTASTSATTRNVRGFTVALKTP